MAQQLTWTPITPDFSNSNRLRESASRTISEVGDTFGRISDTLNKRIEEENRQKQLEFTNVMEQQKFGLMKEADERANAQSLLDRSKYENQVAEQEANRRAMSYFNSALASNINPDGTVNTKGLSATLNSPEGQEALGRLNYSEQLNTVTGMNTDIEGIRLREEQLRIAKEQLANDRNNANTAQLKYQDERKAKEFATNLYNVILATKATATEREKIFNEEMAKNGYFGFSNPFSDAANGEAARAMDFANRNTSFDGAASFLKEVMPNATGKTQEAVRGFGYQVRQILPNASDKQIYTLLASFTGVNPDGWLNWGSGKPSNPDALLVDPNNPTANPVIRALLETYGTGVTKDKDQFNRYRNEITLNNNNNNTIGGGGGSVQNIPSNMLSIGYTGDSLRGSSEGGRMLQEAKAQQEAKFQAALQRYNKMFGLLDIKNNSDKARKVKEIQNSNLSDKEKKEASDIVNFYIPIN